MVFKSLMNFLIGFQGLSRFHGYLLDACGGPPLVLWPCGLGAVVKVFRRF